MLVFVNLGTTSYYLAVLTNWIFFLFQIKNHNQNYQKNYWFNSFPSKSKNHKQMLRIYIYIYLITYYLGHGYKVPWELESGKRVLSHLGLNIFDFFLEPILTIQLSHKWELVISFLFWVHIKIPRWYSGVFFISAQHWYISCKKGWIDMGSVTKHVVAWNCFWLSF